MVPQNFERIGGVMFNVGDVVRNVAANIVGEVVEIDGDTVYNVQDDGAEVDFQLATLVLESAFQAKLGCVVKEDVGSHAYDATYQAVIEGAHEHGLKRTADMYYLEDAKGLLEAGADLLAHSVRDVEVDDELVTLLRDAGVCY